MQSGMLNLGTGPSEKVQHGSATGDGELGRMGDLIEQTRSDLSRTQMHIDQQDEEREVQARRTKTLLAAFGVLLLCLAGAVWFAYPAVKGQRQALVEMFGLRDLGKATVARMDSLEAKLSNSTAGLPGLSDRMDRLQTSMKANFQSASNQARSAATEVGQRVREEMNQSLRAVQSRLAGLESNQQEASEHVTQLQNEIAGLKREIAGMREESVTATERIKELRDQQQSSSNQLTGLDERTSSNQSALNALNNRVERKKVEFEVLNHQTQQIASGVSLTVKRVDAGKHEIDGVLQLGEGQTVPIRAHGIQRPMSFYTSSESRPLELVLTQVTKQGVSGYLLVPGPSVAQAAERE